MQKEPSSLVIGLPHLHHLAITVPQRRHRGILAVGRRAHDRELMNLCHLMDDLLGSAAVSKPPARHGVRLGEAVDQNRPLLHPRNLDDRAVILSRVGQLRINLVGEYVQIMLDADLRDRLEVRPCHDRPGRIVRKWKHEDLCLRCDRRFHLLRCQSELILLLKRDDDRDRVRKDRARLVGNIAGLWNQHLVSGINHGAKGQIDSLRSADRDEDLGYRIIIHAQPSADIGCDLCAELLQTGVRCIEGPSALKRVDALVPDRPGRIKVRLPDAKRDDIIHLRHNVKKFSDAGGLQLCGLFSDRISHGSTSILSSFFFLSKMIPSSLYFFRMK